MRADDRFEEAQALADERFMSAPLRQMPYLSLGDLLITMPAGATAFDYRRELTPGNVNNT